MTRQGRVDLLLGEYFDRIAAGESLSPEAFIRMHPEVAEVLTQQLEITATLEAAFPQRKRAPDHIGRYRVHGVLGRGGMGTVYRASPMDAESGDAEQRILALKVIHPHLLEATGFFRRFLREARMGQAIDHHNVVRTYEVDAVVEGGRPYHYLVMEYVEGQTLTTLLTELGRVPEELCRHIGREVAQGLQAIHGAGGVHRDLKPDNVIVTDEHVVKVMDLGVARLAEEAVRLSQTGHFVGSLEYAAPEQFGASSRTVDARADLHALGTLLYELSTGRHPFRDESAQVVIRRILEEEPRNACELNDRLSSFFGALLDGLLRKAPEDRFESAAEFLRVLEEGEQSAWWRDPSRQPRLPLQGRWRRMLIPRETALQGRKPELRQLRDAYDLAKRGDAQVLLIEGEAGVGKTRLADEFVTDLRGEGETPNYLLGSYPPGGAATAAGPFSSAYRDHFGRSELSQALADRLTTDPSVAASFAAYLKGEPRPADAPALSEEVLHNLFVQVTASLADERPTVLLIDDLHFAPEKGRSLFASLAQAAPKHCLLIIGTMRPGVPGDWLTGLEGLPHVQRLRLARLGAQETVRLVEDVLQSRRLAQEIGGTIALKSDGNPYFVLEILQGLKKDRLILPREDGSWESVRPIHDIQVPSSVTDLIRARLQRLGEVEREILDIAACVGFEFDPSVLPGVTGRGPIQELRALALIERNHGLVRANERRYAFDHHQVQEVLYGDLHPQLRAAYHLAIARTMERAIDAKGGPVEAAGGGLCADLCHHFVNGERENEASRYVGRALEWLDANHRPEAAVELGRRALSSLLPHGSRKRFEQHLLQADRLTLLGEHAEKVSVLENALRHAEALGDAELRARALVALGGYWVHRYDFGRARENLGAARDIAAQNDLPRVAGRVEGILGIGAFFEGQVEVAHASFTRQLELAETGGDDEQIADATGHLGIACFELARFEQSEAHHLRHLELSCARSSLQGECTALGNLVNTYRCMGRFEDARRCGEEHAALARRLGDRFAEARALGNLALVLLADGHLGEAEERMRRYIALGQQLSDPRMEARGRANLALALEPMGRLDEARREKVVARRLFRAAGDRRGETNAVGDLGRIELSRGRTGAAKLLLRRQVALAKAHEAPVYESKALVRLADIAAESDQVSKATAMLQRAYAIAAEIGEAELRFLSAARLAVLGGDGDHAVKELERGAATSWLTSRLEGAFLVWRATDDGVHLHRAKDMLDGLLESTPEQHRESMLKNVRLNREIMEAWEEHGEKPGGEEASA